MRILPASLTRVPIVLDVRVAFSPLSPGHPTGRIDFEIKGAPVREELAREGRVLLLFGCSLVEFLLILSQTGDKLSAVADFVDRKLPPQLGNLLATR